MLRSGQALGGYRIHEVIGVGGMAIVYRAEQMSLGREVALKVLTPSLSDDEAFRRRFQSEGRSIAALDHQNVITVYDSGEVDGQLFLAMRLVPGGETLADLLRVGPIDADSALAVLGPVAAALDAAHTAGLVHRDVKPQNILLGGSGHVYLADFGIAKTANGEHPGTAGFVGTSGYAAPEQVLGKEVTSASDVYALTAVVYRCLTGCRPYVRESDEAVRHAHAFEPPPAVRTGAPGTEEFNRLIATGMAKEPAERFGSAGELLDAVDALVRSLPDASRRRTPTFDGPVPPAGSEAVSDGAVEPTPAAAPTADAPTLSPDTDADTAPTAQTGSGRRVGRGLRIAAAAGGLVAAGVVAIVVVLDNGGAMRHVDGGSVANGGPFAITYSRPWRPAAGTVTGAFALAGATAALSSASQTDASGHPQPGSGSATLAAGRLVRSSPIPGGVPPVLRASYGHPIATTSVQIDGHQARRYAWASARDSVIAYVVPFTGSDSAIICGASAASAAALLACAQLAQTASIVGGGRVLAPGVDVRVARDLGRSFGSVDNAYSRLGGVQSSTSLKTRAAALHRAAKMLSDAASTLGTEGSPSRYAQLVLMVQSRISGEAQSVSELATYATAGNRAKYTSELKSSLAADRKLKDATGTFPSYGLTVPRLAALHLPAVPPIVQTGGAPGTTSGGTPPPPVYPSPTTTTSTGSAS